MRTIPNSGPLRFLEISNIEQVFPTTPEVLKMVLHTKDYSFSKLPRVANGIGNILERKGLLFTQGKERKAQSKLLLAFPHAHIKGLVLRFCSNRVEMFEKVAGVMHASRSGASDGGEKEVAVEMEKWFSLVTLDIIGSSGFAYEFRALESASISGSSNTEEKTGSKLAFTYNTILNTGGPSRILAMLSMIFPFRLVHSLSLERTCNVVRVASTIRRVIAQIITAKKYILAKLPLRKTLNQMTSSL